MSFEKNFMTVFKYKTSYIDDNNLGGFALVLSDVISALHSSGTAFGKLERIVFLEHTCVLGIGPDDGAPVR